MCAVLCCRKAVKNSRRFKRSCFCGLKYTKTYSSFSPIQRCQFSLIHQRLIVHSDELFNDTFWSIKMQCWSIVMCHFIYKLIMDKMFTMLLEMNVFVQPLRGKSQTLCNRIHKLILPFDASSNHLWQRQTFSSISHFIFVVPRAECLKWRLESLPKFSSNETSCYENWK